MTRFFHHPLSMLILAVVPVLAVLSSIPLAISPGPVHASGASVPLLLVTDSGDTADPFGPYLAEILRAEGFPTVATADVGTLTPSLVSGVGVLLLGPTSGLSADQVTTLSDYVNGGGRLIAMRPPASLASLFGVTRVGSIISEPYLRINTGGLGTGFNATPLQVHPSADTYTLSGASAVATLYSSFTAATPYSAVTLATAGQGQAMLWAYDLAQSVVYTRQGNPGRVGEHDGNAGYRTTDLFAGYVDLNDVPIPQADEQQRLLAKAILTLNPVPMPHLWYFPQNAGAVLVLTGDAHGNPAASFTGEVASVQKYGGHITFFVSQAGQPTASDVTAWKQAGHGVGIHPYATPSPPTSTGCGTADGNGIGAGIATDESWFQGAFGLAPSGATRIHDFGWQCWTDAGAIEAAAGLRMDTTVYPWGPWLHKSDGTWAHGYINGSGLPMQMADDTGQIIPVFQQATALVDEQLLSGVASSQEHLTGDAAAAVSRQLLDASLSGGNYAAVMAQAQVDYYEYGEVTTWAEATMAYAQSQGVPIWSADDWLRFTTARANAIIGTPNWDGSHLGFTLTVPSGPDTLPLMVPIISAGGRLASLTVDGATVTYQTRAVKGTSSAIAPVPAGSHAIVATYAAVTPSVSAVAPASGPTAGGTTVTISGTGFDPLATVAFGGVSATGVQVSGNGTSITAASPAHAAGAVDVAVTNPGNRTATVHNAFTYVPPPTITAINPPAGGTAGGAAVTISGTGFQTSVSLTFGGASATGIAVSADGTRITAVLPPHTAGAVDVVVTNPDGQRATVPSGFTYGVITLPPKRPPSPTPGSGGPPSPPPPRSPGAPTPSTTPAPVPPKR